MSDSIYMLI